MKIIAIAILLLFWIFCTIILPRISANLAENFYPLTSNYEFKKSVKQSIENGLDGHDSKSERAKKIEKELLAKYKVDSVQQLPFNFEGYIMQQSEEYSSKAYDLHFKKIFNTLKKQKEFQLWAGVLSPFVSIRNLSMTICNAGLESEIDFQLQAENYRRSFVQKMNNDMKNNSKYDSFDSYRVKKETYNKVADLEIKDRSLVRLLQNTFLEHFLLCIWCCVLFFLLSRSRYFKN